MNARQMIGQRLFSGFPGTSMSEDFIHLVKEHKVGNAILFRHNIENIRQLKELCISIQELVHAETGYPAFIAIDQEGGAVTRLPPDATNVPGAMALAATGKTEYAKEAALITGRELLALGPNFNLAPVMDINSNPENPVIGVRSYGEDCETVIAFGTAAMEGLAEAGILAAAKHFPGHGDTNLDSHLSLPVVHKSREELDALELRSFKAAIGAGIPAVMSSHILFPALEKERVPATMSRSIITKLLKGELGFQGLVISDCLEMDAIKEYYGTVKGTLAAMAAGVDMIFISHTASLAAEAAVAAEAAYLAGQLDPAEMSASVSKILDYKARYLSKSVGDFSIVGSAAHRQRAEAILKESLCEVNLPPEGQPDLGKSPWFLGCSAFLTTLASNKEDKSLSFSRTMAEALGGEATETSIDPTAQEIAELVPRARGHSCIVLGTYNGHLKRGQIELAKALQSSGIPLIVVALRNPYDLAEFDQSVCTFATFEYTPQSLRALTRVLSKTSMATGILPVKEHSDA
ncbi:beta-N-acetylhexosaminidase [Treponema sp.]